MTEESSEIVYTVAWNDESVCDELVAVLDALAEAQKDEHRESYVVDGVRWYGTDPYARTYAILENNIVVVHRLLATKAIEPSFDRFASDKPWRKMRDEIHERLIAAARDNPTPNDLLRRDPLVMTVGLYPDDHVVLTHDVNGVPAGTQGQLVEHLGNGVWIAEFRWHDPSLEGDRNFKTIEVTTSEIGKRATP